MHQKDTPLEHLALKTSGWLLHMAETRGLQKIDSALKGLNQNLTYSEITHRGSMLKKEPESDTLANLRLPKR